MGHFPPSNGSLYILLTVDYVSKLVEVVAFPRNYANTVIGFVQRNILTRYGAPRTIISDEGSHFENKLFSNLMSKYGVRHATGLDYHPQSNGQVEVSMMSVKLIYVLRLFHILFLNILYPNSCKTHKFSFKLGFVGFLMKRK